MLVRRGLVLMTTLASLSICKTASADSTVHFDDLAEGTIVTDQYAASGLRFLNEGNSVPWIKPDARAPSAAQALSIRRQGCSSEFCEALAVAEFDAPHAVLTMRVASYEPSTTSVPVTLTVYDGAKDVLTTHTVSVSASDSAFGTLSVSVPAGTIRSFAVSAAINRRILIDDVTFDVAASDTPDVGVIWNETLAPLIARGESRDISLTLRRYGGSTGAVTFSATALPGGVVASFSPNPSSGLDGAPITLTLSADNTALPQDEATFSIVATPSSGATASGPRTTLGNVTIADGYDARIVGMEITQGAQTVAIPLAHWAPLTHETPYVGVQLVAGRKTVVRLWANLASAPTVGALPKVAPTIQVCAANGTACGAALAPELGARALKLGGSYVNEVMRAATGEAFTYVLPPSAVTATIGIRASLTPPSAFETTLRECSTIACSGNNQFTVTQIPFLRTTDVRIYPIELRHNFIDLPAPPIVFEATHQLMPLRDVWVPPTYMGQINISDLVNDTSMDSSARGVAVLEEVIDHAEDWRYFSTGAYVVGVFGPYGVRAYARRAEGTAVVEATMIDPAKPALGLQRPISSIAHEVGHLFSRPHASNACTATGGESWYPDETGLLNSVGIDVRGGVYRATSGAEPYDVRMSTADGSTKVYDLMSYCGVNGEGDIARWISAHNWDEILYRYTEGPTRETADTARVVAGRGPNDMWVVRALAWNNGSVKITKIGPTTMPTPSNLETSPFELSGYNASGDALFTVSMSFVDTEAEQGGDVPARALIATVPASELARLDLMVQGSVSDTRSASATPPTVAISSPLLIDAQLTPVTVSITSPVLEISGPHARLKVDYSANGGATYRPLYLGPPRSTIEMPRHVLSGATCGKLRARFNDGFSEAFAETPCIEVSARPPTLQWQEPALGQRFTSAGSAVWLQGQAYDDAGEPVSSASLVWTRNGAALGTGDALLADSLPTGDTTLVLVATDTRGLVSEETRVVRCASDGSCEVLTPEQALVPITDPNGPSGPTGAFEDSTSLPEKARGCGCSSQAHSGSLLLAVGVMMRLWRRRRKTKT